MKLIANWRRTHKMFSVHALTILGMLGAIADWMPILREFVPGWVYIAIMIAGIGGRMLNQEKLHES